MKMTERFLSVLSLLISSRICVADENVGIGGEGDRDDDTLTHAARKLERVLIVTDTRLGDTDLLHQLDRLFPGDPLGDEIDHLRRLFLEKIDEFDAPTTEIHRFRRGDFRLVFFRQPVEKRRDIGRLFVELDDDLGHHLPIHRFAFCEKRLPLFRLTLEARFFLGIVCLIIKIAVYRVP